MEVSLQKIEQVFAKTVKKDHVDANTELRELGLDSLDLVELMMELEEEFSIEFNNDEMLGFKTVKDVYLAIEAKVKK
jgi:acyl carrier protein